MGRESAGPLQEAQHKYAAMVTGAPHTNVVPLSVLCHHFQPDARNNTFDVKWQAISKSMGLSGQLWSRCEVPLSQPPLCWMDIRDEDLDIDSQSKKVSQLYGCLICDADEHFTVPQMFIMETYFFA